jgi:hypothetical protein
MEAPAPPSAEARDRTREQRTTVGRDGFEEGSSEAAGKEFRLPTMEWDVETLAGAAAEGAAKPHVPAEEASAPPEVDPQVVRPQAHHLGPVPELAQAPGPAEAVAPEADEVSEPAEEWDQREESIDESGADKGGTASGRIPKPMIAAAAMVGLTLIGLPLLLSHLGSSAPHLAPGPPAPPGYSQQAGNSGFVPGGFPTAGPNAAAPPGALSPAQSAAAPHHVAQVAAGGPNLSSGGTSGGGSGGTSGGSSGGSSGGTTGGQPGAAPARYAATAGSGCTSAGVTVHAYGWYNQGRSGWQTNTAGGYTGDGCDGKYASMPMSGNANQDDSSNFVLWTFATGQVSSGSCQVQVYIPDDSSITAVGGTSAFYTVADGSGPVGSFTVDQVAHRGQWMNAGTYPVSGGQLDVQLHSRGVDYSNSGGDNAHLAAAAVQVSCTA